MNKLVLLPRQPAAMDVMVAINFALCHCSRDLRHAQLATLKMGKVT